MYYRDWQQGKLQSTASRSGSNWDTLAQATKLIFKLSRWLEVFDQFQKHLDVAYPGTESPSHSKGQTRDTL